MGEQAETEDELIRAARPFFGPGFGGVIRVETTDGDRSFWVDGRGMEATVQPHSPSGVERGFCLWRASAETLLRLFTRERRRLESAYISGRLKIAGDMSVMARLEPVDG